MDKVLLADVRTKFKETWQRMDSLFTLYAKSHGISFATLLVLELLYDADTTYTQKGISEKYMIPKQSINAIITSLWQQGYVELKESNDRRNKNIFLTETGKEYAGEILRCLEDTENSAWECLTDEEVIAFMGTMEKFEKSFERIVNSRKGEVK